MDKNYLLTQIAEQLDIPPSMHKLASERYGGVAKYLIGKGVPADIYSQGSFQLGTVIRPFKGGKDSDYDIDLVCQIDYKKGSANPKDLKLSIGELLRQSKDYGPILDVEGKRCWTLNYADVNGVGFHLDILPSIPEDSAEIQRLAEDHTVPMEYANSAIVATNKDNKTSTYSWTPSNPAGYSEWFNEINKPFYDLIDVKKLRNQLFESNQKYFASIEEVPENLIKTSLQRVIQILKRHRDIRFSGSPFEDSAPISIIITTLCAVIVEKNGCLTTDISELLNFIVNKLYTYAKLIDSAQIPFQESNGVIRRHPDTKEWIISNPVNPNENFADRWHEENNKRAVAFFKWVQWLKEDLGEKNTFELGSIKRGFGEKLIEGIIEKNAREIINVNDTPFRPTNVNITSPNKPYAR